MANSTSKPSKDDSLSPKEEREMREALRDIFATDFPNQERRGCPENVGDKLKALAWRRKFPEAQEIISHLGSCSPCYQEHEEFVRQHKSRQRVYRVAALGLIVLGIAAWASWALMRNRGTHVPQPPSIVKTPPEPASPPPTQEPSVLEPKLPEIQVVVLDLRKRGISRGENSNKEEDLALPKGRLRLSIYLPIGSEAGDYEVRISGRRDHIVMAKGRTAVKNRINTLTVELDTSAFKAGNSSLAIRQSGWAWYRYPLKLN